MTLIVIALILYALIGAPLYAVFGAAGLALFLSLPEGSMASAAIDVFSAKFAESPNLMNIPLFTFAGYMLAESGTPRRLVEASKAWLGWMPGGLAAVCLLASAFFTTFTGGSGITIVAVGGLLFPALLSEKYPEKFSLGLITTGGSLGLLFPPSVPLIIYGIVAGLIVGKVLLAGIIPGILTVAVLVGYASYTGLLAKVPRTSFEPRRAFAALWEIKWEAIIPFALIGGLGSGLFRVHEASAFTAVYVLIIEVFVYRDVKIRSDLPRIVRESMTLVGAIMTIMATAIGFTGWMIQAQVPTKLVDVMESLITSQVAFLLVLNVFLLVVGMLMDIFTALVVVVPLILPLAYAYDVDPYHLAVIFILNLEIGYLTPPVGMNLFISSIRFDKPVTWLYKSVLPYIAILMVALGIVTYIPILSTWLPSFVEVAGENKPISPSESMDLQQPSAEDQGMEPLPEPDEEMMQGIYGAEDAGVGDDAGVAEGDAGQGAAEEEAGEDLDWLYDD